MTQETTPAARKPSFLFLAIVHLNFLAVVSIAPIVIPNLGLGLADAVLSQTLTVVLVLFNLALFAKNVQTALAPAKAGVALSPRGQAPC